MIRLEQPAALLLAAGWVVFWVLFARIQVRACGWIWAHVGARFRRRWTLHGPASLRRHLAWLLVWGLVLALAAARPTRPGGTVRELDGRVVFLLDASASMRASDAEPLAAGAEPGAKPSGRERFDQARELVAAIAARLPRSQAALVTFSGVATLQLPMTADPADLAEALRVVEVHSVYRQTGSSFGAALDRALHFADGDRRDLQAVLVSDGEQPFEESLAEPLAALAGQGVAVHTLAVGSPQGQGRVIWDFRDVAAGKETKRALREFTTRRADALLEEIARATGGRFAVAGPGAAEAVAAAIAERLRETESASDRSRGELSPWLLFVALALFVGQGLVYARWETPEPRRFELERLGRAALAVLVALAPLVAACARLDPGLDPVGRASRENERGIAADGGERWADARTHYERGAAFGVEAQIPTYNLARSLSLQGDFAEAHEVYQRALELAPELAPAHYNDGVALFAWGVAERDPRGCHLERTRERWAAAARRFTAARELYEPRSPGWRDADANHAAVAAALETLDARIADPPPECLEPSPPPQAGGGESPPPAGGDPPPPGGGAGGGPGPPPLTSEENETIAEAFARLAEQRHAEGKFHRRTRPEQFPAESWKNPDPEIWW